jgi:predicted ferric reductase
VALLSVVFLAIHVLSSVADSYVSISFLDAVLPFGSSYRPFWVGLGAVSLDLMLAVVVTSLLRRRIGHRVWRATHWLAYASWPIALAHSLGTGTDAGSGWMLALSALCVATVGAAVLARIAGDSRSATSPPPVLSPGERRRRAAAALALAHR